MAKCEICGKNIILYTKFDDVRICNACASTINLSAWINRDCDTLDDLKIHKDNALSSAAKHNFPPSIIDKIQTYFDSYIVADYVTTINGKSGQFLKLFKNYCIIDTKDESKRSNLLDDLHFFEPAENDDDNVCSEDSLFSTKDVGRIVQGFMTGGIIKTGINIATSAYINTKEKEKAEEQKHKKEKQKRRSRESVITVGERRILFSECKRVDVCNPEDSSIGCLKFIPRETDYYLNCDYFFFKNSSAIPFESKKIRNKMAEIAGICNKNISEIKLQHEHEESERQTQLIQQVQHQNSFEQIRKYKQLFDEGIITEEEFAKKKKELLGL